jgi:hypothetical protein
MILKKIRADQKRKSTSRRSIQAFEMKSLRNNVAAVPTAASDSARLVSICESCRDQISRCVPLFYKYNKKLYNGQHAAATRNSSYPPVALPQIAGTNTFLSCRTIMIDLCTDELIRYQYMIKKILRCDLQRK